MEKFSWRKEHMDEYIWKISTFLCSCIWFRDCEQIFIQYFKNNSHPLTSRGKSASPRTVRGATCSSEKKRGRPSSRAPSSITFLCGLDFSVRTDSLHSLHNPRPRIPAPLSCPASRLYYMVLQALTSESCVPINRRS